MGKEFIGQPYDNGLIVYHGELYVGGIIFKAGEDTSNRGLARWDGKQWKQVYGGTNSEVAAFQIYQDTLYVGGYFTTVGSNNDTSFALAKWYTPACAYLKAEIDTLWQDVSKVAFRDTSAGLWRTQWQWDFGDGESDTLQHPVHTYQTAGTYNVQMIVSHEQCVDTATFEVTVQPPAGIRAGQDPEVTMSIIPNPSDNVWQIKVQGSGVKDQGSNGEVLLKIYTITGQEVHSRPIQSSDLSISVDVRNYEVGVYICTLEVDGNVITSQKAIVE